MTEHILYREIGQRNEPAVIPTTLTILALVAARIGDPGTQATYADDWDICLDGGVSPGPQPVLQPMAASDDGGLDTRRSGEVASERLRHPSARAGRGRKVGVQTGDTFRFRRQGDQLRFYEADTPARMSNSRFQALATTIQELGFVESLYARATR